MSYQTQEDDRPVTQIICPADGGSNPYVVRPHDSVIVVQCGSASTFPLTITLPDSTLRPGRRITVIQGVTISATITVNCASAVDSVEDPVKANNPTSSVVLPVSGYGSHPTWIASNGQWLLVAA